MANPLRKQKTEQRSASGGSTKTGSKTSGHDSRESARKKKPDPYLKAIEEYNTAHTALTERGLRLLRLRERTVDLIEFVELLVNSVANTPKSFETDFEEVHVKKAQFRDAEEFARKDLDAARKSAATGVAGAAAGVAVASVAPTAALWVATTFGTASTGTAISTLSGAAATKAALAWLGGGALATGGSGMAGGTALLALAGPVGWSLAGATLLTSIVVFTVGKIRNRKAKEEALAALKKNTAAVKRSDAKVNALAVKADSLRTKLAEQYGETLKYYGSDFLSLSQAQRLQLGALVNNTKACAVQLGRRVTQDDVDA